MTDNTFIGDILFSTVIQGRDVAINLPRRIASSLRGLPPASPAFTGRDADLAALLDTLAPGRTATGVAVGGMGGIGKTELVLHAAGIALGRGWFPGGVLFVDMFGYDPDPANRLDAGQALESMLRGVAVPAEHIPPATQDRARMFRSVLSTYAGAGRRVLVVVDNVSGSDHVRPLLPGDGVNAVIVTSRQILADLDGRLLDLDTLSVEEAVELLHRALSLRNRADTRVTRDRDDARKLARLCGGLPLALQIIAALLAEDPAKPVAAMAAELGDAATLLEEMTYAGRAVRAVFDVSYQRLDTGHARLFRLLSLGSGPDIATPAVAALAGLSADEARRGLEALTRAHLTEPGVGYERWRMHDLLRLYSAHHGHANAESDERAQALNRLLDHYLTTARAANTHLDGRAVADPAASGFTDRRQALAWLDAEFPNLTAATYAAGATDTSRALALLRSMQGFMLWRRHFDDMIAMCAAVRDAARRAGDRHDEAQVLCDLGIALCEARRFDEAITAGRDAARICHETGDRYGEARALIVVGSSAADLQLLDEAVTACRDAAQIFHLLGEPHAEGAALTQYGIALRKAGRFDEAISAHGRAAEIFREVGDRHRESGTMNNLGNSLSAAGRNDEAVAAHWRDLEIRREMGDRHGEGVALDALGDALQLLGRTAEAIAYHRDAVEAFRETGDQHRENFARESLDQARRSHHGPG